MSERAWPEAGPVVQRLLDEAYRLIAGLPLLALALVVVWVGWLLGRWVSQRALLDRFAQTNPFLRDLTRTTIRWSITALAGLVALEILDATAIVGALLGTAGVLGVALGFAFKDILENYLAGILMSLRQPFSPRDHVVIDGNEGLVIALNSRATVLMTLDGNHLRLPNALVFRSVTLNYTRNPSRRFEFDVGVGVNQSLLRAQAVGIAELAKVDGVIDRPPPRALVIALGDSLVQVRYHAWVDQRSNDFGLVKSEAIRRVKLALEAAGIDMPEPSYRLRIDRKAEVPPSPPPGETSLTDVEVACTDTRALNDIESQIAHDPQRGGDLLNAQAPKE